MESYIIHQTRKNIHSYIPWTPITQNRYYTTLRRSHTVTPSLTQVTIWSLSSSSAIALNHLQSTIAINHCNQPPQSTTAINRCKQPLQSTIAINHCKQPLQSTIAVNHCSQPLQSNIALNHCSQPLQPAIANEELPGILFALHPVIFLYRLVIGLSLLSIFFRFGWDRDLLTWRRLRKNRGVPHFRRRQCIENSKRDPTLLVGLTCRLLRRLGFLMAPLEAAAAAAAWVGGGEGRGGGGGGAQNHEVLHETAKPRVHSAGGEATATRYRKAKKEKPRSKNTVKPKAKRRRDEEKTREQ